MAGCVVRCFPRHIVRRTPPLLRRPSSRAAATARTLPPAAAVAAAGDSSSSGAAAAPLTERRGVRCGPAPPAGASAADTTARCLARPTSFATERMPKDPPPPATSARSARRRATAAAASAGERTAMRPPGVFGVRGVRGVGGVTGPRPLRGLPREPPRELPREPLRLRLNSSPRDPPDAPSRDDATLLPPPACARSTASSRVRSEARRAISSAFSCAEWGQMQVDVRSARRVQRRREAPRRVRTFSIFASCSRRASDSATPVADRRRGGRPADPETRGCLALSPPPASDGDLPRSPSPRLSRPEREPSPSAAPLKRGADDPKAPLPPPLLLCRARGGLPSRGVPPDERLGVRSLPPTLGRGELGATVSKPSLC